MDGAPVPGRPIADSAGGRLTGRVAAVTGAGAGLGRAHARRLAELGARVLVNDVRAAADVAAEITAGGGTAVTDGADVGSWAGAESVVGHALDAFGRLDILVNNAGVLRPKTIVGMTESDLRAVLDVHLVGTVATTHAAARHWRKRAKAGERFGGRLINTTSTAGLFGTDQANYAAAKGAIAAFTAVAATELGRYGVTVNAVAPIALTEMSASILAAGSFDPAHVAELVGWLATDAATDITGRVFLAGGGHLSVVDRWHTGPAIEGMWTVDALDAEVPRLLAGAAANPDGMGYRPDEPGTAVLRELRGRSR